MIINPWFFYAIQICDNIVCVLCVIGIFALIIAGFAGLGLLVDTYSMDIEEKVPKFIKKTLAIGCTCLVVAVFVPTKETLIEMQIAKLATKENIDSAVTYVIDTVKEFTAEEDK